MQLTLLTNCTSNLNIGERKVYKAPISKVFHVEDLELILHSSFEGQHNPGHHGSGPSSAKKAMSFSLEEGYEEGGELDEE